MLDSGLQLERTILAWIRTLLLLVVNLVLVARSLVGNPVNILTILLMISAVGVFFLSASLLNNITSGSRRKSTHFLVVSLFCLLLIGIYWYQRFYVAT
ncbi:DUF202 domain-containing protein [Vibrio parahaemolyticus]|nr:DUF202 domain-containing protein [Vibrio parahaemolyticus]